MYTVGQEVVLMSAPGRFRIVAVEGTTLTLESAGGQRRTVSDQSVRVVPPRNS